VLTLYTTPVIYIYFDRLQTWMMRRKKKEEAASSNAQTRPAE
jgi:hypothetical protein